MISRRRFNLLAAGAASGAFGVASGIHRAYALQGNIADDDLGRLEDELLYQEFMVEELGLDNRPGRNAFGPLRADDGSVQLNGLNNLAGFPEQQQVFEEASLDFAETVDYSRETIENLLANTPSYGEIDATFEWPVFERAMDTHHLRKLGEPAAGAAFDITGELLERLAASNHFDLDYHFTSRKNAYPTLFILRGCKLEEKFDASSPWKEGIRVSYAPPVHASVRVTPNAAQSQAFYNRRGCVMGAWDRATNTLTAVEANSVPTQDFARRTVGEDAILNCSVLPTGFYRYYFGKMGNGKQAFRKEKDDYIVLRSPFDVNFDPFDTINEFGEIENTAIWTTGRYHHIHDTASGTGYGAGCTIINRNDRSWEGLLNALRMVEGLQNLPPKSDAGPYLNERGRPYQFFGMLLTGAEAAMMASGGESFARDYKRLRIGSGGRRYQEVVQAFQRRAVTEAARLDIDASLFGALGDDGMLGRSSGIAALILNKHWQRESGARPYDHSAPIIEL